MRPLIRKWVGRLLQTVYEIDNAKKSLSVRNVGSLMTKSGQVSS